VTKERGPRVNHQIKISPVRIIDEDGEQLGIMEVYEARTIAEERGLDLVEVAPTARPPVCKIMDYGKYKYEQAKQAKEAKKKQHQVHVKEMKFRPKIDDHDYDFKVAHVREFLEKGDKVKLTIMFRGREMMHQEFGLAILKRVEADLADLSMVEQEPKSEGRNMTMVLAPSRDPDREKSKEDGAGVDTEPDS
jgi:translation initiation factor IF-3